MKADLYLKNGIIVTEDNTFLGNVIVTDGKIAAVVEHEAITRMDVDATDVIDLGGKTLLPGLVDAHVHFNEPGRTHWEGYETGSKAAAAGGITTVLEMPLNASPPSIDVDTLAQKRQMAQGKSFVDYAHWGGLVDNNLDDLDALDAAGVIGFKGFLSDSAVDFERINDDLLYAGLLRSRELSNVVGVHAENEWVTSLKARQLTANGRIDRLAWPESRPPSTELEAVNRALYWAEKTGGNLHIVHTTLAAAMQAANQAKQKGVHITVETCPHYLFFDLDEYLAIGPEAKCAPPIRSRKEVNALWQCVLDGLVDIIASDHSPCPTEDKEKGIDNIWQAWGGITGIQTMLSAILTVGVHERGLPLSRLVTMMCANPAKIFGLYPQKGSLLPGADADMVIVDLDREWTLATNDLLSRNQHSAYVGQTFKGIVDRTIVRGNTVYAHNAITIEPGYGQLLRRQHRYTPLDTNLRGSEKTIKDS